jgi:hypothetical protein
MLDQGNWRPYRHQTIGIRSPAHDSLAHNISGAQHLRRAIPGAGSPCPSGPREFSMPTRTRLVVAALAAGAVVAGVAASIPAATAASGIPIGQTTTGKATYYNDAGFGACGTALNAATEMLVAVSHTWWTTANPNNDPVCQGISVEATYNGKTITVPVKDKCPSCEASHIDLSQAAFAQFASVDPANTPGVLNVSWKFVSAAGGATPSASGSSGPGGAVGPSTSSPSKPRRPCRHRVCRSSRTP